MSTVQGTVRGTDLKPIQNFSVQVTNTSDEIILNQNFTNGSYTLDAVPGYHYWFDAPPLYGGVLVDGSQLLNSNVISIPANFMGISDTGKNIYYAVALSLIGITLINELKKQKKGRRR